MTIEQRLIKELGTTDDPVFAVWLLRDGTYVNGTIEGHQRDIDHHEISAFYRPSKRQQPGVWGLYVYKFMNRGNIRVGCSDMGWCFEMTKKPSREQADQLYRAIMDARECGTKACFGRKGSSRTNPAWEDEFRFLEYLNRYTDYYPPIDVQEHYYEYTGRPLIDYGY